MSDHKDIMQFQRTIGNRAVSQLIKDIGLTDQHLVQQKLSDQASDIKTYNDNIRLRAYLAKQLNIGEKSHIKHKGSYNPGNEFERKNYGFFKL
jgi:hypothetical protein